MLSPLLLRTTIFALLTGCSSPPISLVTPAPARVGTSTPAKYGGLDDLYVADYDSGTVFLLKNGGFTPDGSITNGISGPWAVTLDATGNLYVANATGYSVTEYAPGTSTPSFTYSFGMISPRAIAVDAQGHLFVSDFSGYNGPGRISEYPQESNQILASCNVSGLFGAAVDSSGDVFVGYNSQRTGGHIEEFVGGLKGCSPTPLGANVEYATGMVLDRKNNLIVGAAHANLIDVIPPPYSKISRYLHSDGGAPLFVSIGKSNKHVYASIGRFYHSYVLVIDYATGRPIRRIGYSRGGFGSPYGVVDAPNEVP
jgi:DNA-binding beta-propeller fold protein YncE